MYAYTCVCVYTCVYLHTYVRFLIYIYCVYIYKGICDGQFSTTNSKFSSKHILFLPKNGQKIDYFLATFPL